MGYNKDVFENYKATKKDLEAIEEGIRAVWRPEMDFIFKKKDVFDRTSIISFDSQFIYLWSKHKFSGLKRKPASLPEYYFSKIPHQLSFVDEDYAGWRASLFRNDFYRLLPKLFVTESQFAYPVISGGLLAPFIKIHQERPDPLDAYNTRESFLATIVHEFGHIYRDQYKLWWYSNKKENLHYLNSALKLYQGKKIPRLRLKFPTPYGIHELYAFCVEYEASSIFWPNHQQNLNIFIKYRLKELIKDEKKKDLEREDSVLEPSRNPHDLAFVFGKIILNRYPKTWPQILTSPKILRLTI